VFSHGQLANDHISLHASALLNSEKSIHGTSITHWLTTVTAPGKVGTIIVKP
jgi:hypothetical protein